MNNAIENVVLQHDPKVKAELNKFAGEDYKLLYNFNQDETYIFSVLINSDRPSIRFIRIFKLGDDYATSVDKEYYVYGKSFAILP